MGTNERMTRQHKLAALTMDVSAGFVMDERGHVHRIGEPPRPALSASNDAGTRADLFESRLAVDERRRFAGTDRELTKSMAANVAARFGG